MFWKFKPQYSPGAGAETFNFLVVHVAKWRKVKLTSLLCELKCKINIICHERNMIS